MTATNAVSITTDEHHMKAHLVAYDVLFQGPNQCPACPGGDCVGRSFLVKTLVESRRGPIIQINYGDEGRLGYSTSYAFANLRTLDGFATRPPQKGDNVPILVCPESE